MPRTVARLTLDVEERIFCTGAQVCVLVEDRIVLDAAYGVDGLSRPFTPATRSAVYCAMKPLVATAALALWVDGVLDLDAELGRCSDELARSAVATVTVRHLLTHQAGVHAARSVPAAVLTPSMRHHVGLATGPPAGWDPASDGAYSEWAGFHLLRLAMEAAAAEDLRSILDRLVLRPLGLEGEVSLGFEPDDDAGAARVGVNVDLRGPRPIPLLFERAPSFRIEDDPSLSGFATMRGLAIFYAWVLRALDGEEGGPLPPAVVAEMVRPHRPVVHDQILDRRCPWGLGFMVDLERLGFGPDVGARSFGHTGQVGTSTAYADPDRKVAVAVLSNGVIDQATGMQVRRPAIVSDIARDVEEQQGRRPS